MHEHILNIILNRNLSKVHDSKLFIMQCKHRLDKLGRIYIHHHYYHHHPHYYHPLHHHDHIIFTFHHIIHIEMSVSKLF